MSITQTHLYVDILIYAHQPADYTRKCMSIFKYFVDIYAKKDLNTLVLYLRHPIIFNILRRYVRRTHKQPTKYAF